VIGRHLPDIRPDIIWPKKETYYSVSVRIPAVAPTIPEIAIVIKKYSGLKWFAF